MLQHTFGFDITLTCFQRSKPLCFLACPWPRPTGDPDPAPLMPVLRSRITGGLLGDHLTPLPISASPGSLPGGHGVVSIHGTSSAMTTATTAAPSANGKGKANDANSSSAGNTGNTGGSQSFPAAPAADTTGSATGISAIAAAEQAQCYRSFGPAYVGTGITGDLSVELGITTGSGPMQQRSGVGIYLRSDHMAHRYASQLLI